MANLVKQINTAEDKVGSASYDYAYIAHDLVESFKTEDEVNGFSNIQDLAIADRAHGGLGATSYQTFARRERVGRALIGAEVEKKAIKDSGAGFSSIARVASILKADNWKVWAEKANPTSMTFAEFEVEAEEALKAEGIGRVSKKKKTVQSEMNAVLKAMKLKSKVEGVKRVPRKAMIQFTSGDDVYVISISKVEPEVEEES